MAPQNLQAAPGGIETLPKDELQKLTEYLGQQTIFVVDQSGASRRRIANMVISLGAYAQKVALFGTIDEAEEEIAKKKPKVIISDYAVGKRSGLDLIPPQKKALPDARDTLFVLVTANTSQSAVARAAEEDVDRFILKPYTIGAFTQTLAFSFIDKLFPSAYRRKVEEGKELLFSGKVDESLVVFEKAMDMDPAPALACFYYAQAEMMKQAYMDAQGTYLKGLNYNRIHYKCLVGLFDLLMDRKLYAEAYGVIRRMQKYFPANPKRIASVIRLAVLNHKYTDIEELYPVFTELEFRDRDVIKHMCAGLIVTAQHLFAANPASSNGVDLLNKAAISCAGDSFFLRRIMEVLSDMRRPEPMAGILARFPHDQQKGQDFLISSYLQQDLNAAPGVSIQNGLALIRSGTHSPFLYRTLARRYLELGKRSEAENMVQDALKRWPAEEGVFKTIVAALKLTL